MTNSAIDKHRKIYCNTCKGETHHELLFTHSKYHDEVTDDPSPYLIFQEEFQYRFWICLGCDTATFQEAYTNTGMLNELGEQIWESSLHPKRAHTDLSLKHFRQLDTKLNSIYREIIECFNINSKILCAIGLRALIEGICADKQIKGKALDQKIDGLKSYLPSNIVDNLHGFRFMGNDAAHTLQAPTRNELQLAIEVMEDLLNFLYELEYKARSLPGKK